MKLVIFGLTVSSSWGNGHATLWRGLIRALARRGHEVVFFERDVPYYASHRDLCDIPGGRLHFYEDWEETLPLARRELDDADAAAVTSYCPDGRAASRLVLASPAAARVFYDLDTPVTLAHLRDGEAVDYLPIEGLGAFDLVLSYTGGQALDALRNRLGARRAVPLYGHVDPEAHHPVAPVEEFRCDLSYLGTYAEDRQAALLDLFVEPARRRPERAFLIGGAMYPADFPWTENIVFARHVSPDRHPAFFSSSRFTLNVTRRAMADMGYCPSGRLFEAAACGCPLISDWFDGLDAFFTPGEEILVARSTGDAVAALDLTDAERRRIAQSARERVLEEHTAARRAAEMLDAIGAAGRARRPDTGAF